jgi:L-seryl-tRNA(Ser) seleniumtransferase
MTASDRDRFGHPIDPTVGYARGAILKGTDEEVRKTLRARQLVGARVEGHGRDAVYDLSGMNRGAALGADDLPNLSSHVPFFAAFEGRTEPFALRHMGADPARHDAVILNRVSAANFISLTTIVTSGDRVLALAPPGGITHPSVRRPLAMAGAIVEEFHTVAGLERAWHAAAPRLLVVTPISASKHHLDGEEFRRALRLPRHGHTLVYVDDAHMASRVAMFGEPPAFGMGDVDLAVCSSDKHVAGPRAGVLVGRKDLITTIRSHAFELGLDAQASQYVGVGNALRDFDPKPVADAGQLARELLDVLVPRYGSARVYLGGPGVSMGGEDALEIARAAAGRSGDSPLVPVEAACLVGLSLLEQDGILTIGAVAMPGSAPVVRLMMYPDGGRLGVARIAAALERALDRLAQAVAGTVDARALLLG